ncbi:NTPase [Candidatus Bathyarchaeota archaeon]|nr:NTPase [Candidatus Bathyarchaeota archaeon]
MFLTGPPRIGKTTIVLKVAEELRDMGLKVGGMISQETREGGVRVGFKIVDLETGVEGILAHINRRSGPPVGKYRVCLEDLENVGVKAILNACKGSDLIVIDEVGPMELHSEAFRKAVLEALNSGKTSLGTIHYRASSPFIDAIRKRRDIKIIEVTYGNRDGLSKTIAKEIFKRVSKY